MAASTIAASGMQQSLGVAPPGRLNTRMGNGQHQRLSDDLTEDAVPQTPTGNVSDREGPEGACAKEESNRMPSTLNNTQTTAAPDSGFKDSGFSEPTRSDPEASKNDNRLTQQIKGEHHAEGFNLLEWDEHTPLHLKYPDTQFDFVLYYAENDKAEAMTFFKRISNSLNPHGITGCLFDDTFALEHEEVNSMFSLAEDLTGRSTYMLFYITETFKEDFQHEYERYRVAANTFDMNRDHCLTLSLYDPLKKWCLVPVFTKPKYKFKSLPFGLLGLAGLTIDGTNDYLERAKKLFSTEKAKKLKRQRKITASQKLEEWKIKHANRVKMSKEEPAERKSQVTQGSGDLSLRSQDLYQNLGVEVRHGAAGGRSDQHEQSAQSTEVKQRVGVGDDTMLKQRVGDDTMLKQRVGDDTDLKQREPMQQGRQTGGPSSIQPKQQANSSLHLQTGPNCRSQQQQVITQPESAKCTNTQDNSFFSGQSSRGSEHEEYMYQANNPLLERNANKPCDGDGGASFDSGVGSSLASSQFSDGQPSVGPRSNSSQRSGPASQVKQFPMSDNDLEMDGPVDELDSGGSSSPSGRTRNSRTYDTAYTTGETDPKQYYPREDTYASVEEDKGHQGDGEDDEASVTVTVPDSQCESLDENGDFSSGKAKGDTVIYNIHIHNSAQIQVGSHGTANMNLPDVLKDAQTGKSLDITARLDEAEGKSAGSSMVVTETSREDTSSGPADRCHGREGGQEVLARSMAVQDGADEADDFVAVETLPKEKESVVECSSATQPDRQALLCMSETDNTGKDSSINLVEMNCASAAPRQSKSGSAVPVRKAKPQKDYRQSGQSAEGTPV